MARHRLNKTAPAARDRTLRTASDLAAANLIQASQRSAIESVAARYAVAISPDIAALIEEGDPSDPIGRQFIPDPAELVTDAEERSDPIGDDAHSPVEGLVHRYPDRVLLKPVHVCPAYCRYCFRREMVGPRGRGTLAPAAMTRAIAYIRAHPEIWEVILTGGEPLLLSLRRLREVMRQLSAIDHVKVVRVHTRMPVVAPAAITPALVRAIKVETKPTYVVLHVNHARELTQASRAACARIVDAGIPMLSQSVLLRGVNDDAETLDRLMRALVENRIKPYYLHQGDLAPGTAHLRAGVDDGQDLMRVLRGRLSGIAQPTYVLDIPGGAGKVPIGPNYLRRLELAPNAPPTYEIEDPRGRRHLYRPNLRRA